MESLALIQQKMAFSAIQNFVSDLSESFNNNRPLSLYNKLVGGNISDQALRKHVELFKNFCIHNREGIVDRNIDLFNQNRIVYSDKAYLDFSYIFGDSLEEDGAIWRHLLTVSAIVDQEGEAKKVLESLSAVAQSSENTESCKSDRASSSENVLGDIVAKLSSQINVDTDDPMKAVQGLINSGVFAELVQEVSTKIKEGKIDLASTLKMAGMAGFGGANMPASGFPLPQGQSPSASKDFNLSSFDFSSLANLTAPRGPTLENIDEDSAVSESNEHKK